MKKPSSENCKAVLKLKCIETGTSKTVAIYDIVREISATVSAAMKRNNIIGNMFSKFNSTYKIN